MKKEKENKLKCALLKRIATISLIFLFGVAGFWAFKVDLFQPKVADHVTTEGWIRYASPDNTFNVDFPKLPEEIKKDLSVPSQGIVLKYSEYKSAVDEQVTYSISHVELPRRWTLLSTKTILKTALDLISKNEGNTEVLSKDFALFGKHTVLDFHAKKTVEEKAVETKGRLLLVGTALYKLSVTYTPNADQKPDEQHMLFLSSFQKKG